MSIYKMVGYDVEVVRKSICHMYLRVLSPDGALRITAPKKVSDEELCAFFESKVAWVKKQRAKLAEKRQIMAPRWENGAKIALLGKEYTLLLVPVKKSPKVCCEGATLVVEYRAEEERAVWERRLLAFCQNILFEEVGAQFAILEKKMGISPSSFYIRDMKTRWGTCNTKTGRICINLRLVFAPLPCLTYVLIHELCHLWVPNHGAAFYEVLSRYCPDYKVLQAQLKGITILFLEKTKQE